MLHSTCLHGGIENILISLKTYMIQLTKGKQQIFFSSIFIDNCFFCFLFFVFCFSSIFLTMLRATMSVSILNPKIVIFLCTCHYIHIIHKHLLHSLPRASKLSSSFSSLYDQDIIDKNDLLTSERI